MTVRFSSALRPIVLAWPRWRVQAARAARAVLVAPLMLCLVCAAQDTAGVGIASGDWVGKYDIRGVGRREVRIKIDGSTGTWQTQARNRYDACEGKLIPLEVSEAGPDGFKLTLQADKALAGCGTVELTFKREGDGTWASEFPGGVKILVSR